METLDKSELEALVLELNDDEQREAYKAPFDTYKPLLLPRILGHFLMGCGNLVYGNEPSYLKFRAVEVIARVPYHSWDSASFTLLTCFYADETKAMNLSGMTHYARMAQDNETMHVIVVTQLAKQEGKSGVIRHTIIPMAFAFFYYVVSYFLYLLRPRWSFELNYLFESHAFEQYSRFLEVHEEELKKKPIMSDFLTWYGRNPISQYDFFRSVRNDELVHRNQSVRDINFVNDAHRVRLLVSVGIIAVLGILLFSAIFC